MELEFKQVCALFGGPSNVSRIVTPWETDSRDVRRRLKENEARKPWLEKLANAVPERIEQIRESNFSVKVQNQMIKELENFAKNQQK